jgi:hypothetical protein
MVDPLTAMVSYSWDDAAAAELLHEELALRGFVVFHDRCSFPLGGRIAQSMADAVATCDAFVAYFTPSSLYLGSADGTPRPAIDDEFVPMMKRWRIERARESKDGPPAPIVVPLTHGLGDPRSAAPKQVLEATGEDISSLWMPVVLDQTTPNITQAEAGEFARCLVRATLTAQWCNSEDPIELMVVTRGEGQPPAFLTVDATPSLGGTTSRPGQPADWIRFLAGLTDLQAALARSCTQRRIRLVSRSHLSACLAVGRVFNQAAGWRLTVAGRHGQAELPASPTGAQGIETIVDPVGGDGPLSVEIDLLGANVTDLATEAIRQGGYRPCARVQILRTERGDISPDQSGELAADIAATVRRVVSELRPQVTQIFCACPAEVAVLLGHRLTSLHSDLQLHERQGEAYTPSLVIPSDIP